MLPKAKLAFIGGSSTYSINFPEDIDPQIKVLEKKTFLTPFGESPEFKLFEIDGEVALTVRMHGWRSGFSRADSSRQLFWVLREASVKNIVAEGGVGTIRKDFKLRHFIIPVDYIDLSLRRDICLSDDYLLIMRDPICPQISKLLAEVASRFFPERQINSGVYVVTDGRHFESRAEVKMIKSIGGDVIGQSLCPEVYLAREIGACYGGIYLIVNRAEGISPDWDHDELREIFYQEATNVGKIILETLKRIKEKGACQCQSFRKETLLK